MTVHDRVQGEHLRTAENMSFPIWAFLLKLKAINFHFYFNELVSQFFHVGIINSFIAAKISINGQLPLLAAHFALMVRLFRNV